MRNTLNTDILCSNRDGTKFVHIQVKTYVPGNKTVSVGKKAERDSGANFVWVLAGIPMPEMDKAKGWLSLHGIALHRYGATPDDAGKGAAGIAAKSK